MRIAGRFILILAVIAAALLADANGRVAVAARYSAIVMDMRDGTVLFESDPDRRLAPASLTKMMTLYLAFEAVQNGQLKLNKKVRISRRASRQPASKLYLKTGQRVSIQSLIRATAIKSANDAAVALAEAVGGSEKSFARLMTAKARQLGMTNTTFRNASGLTARGQFSTARDMATLGRHLFFDFPQYYNLFSRRTAIAAGKRVYNTNRKLLSSYAGADGIKTGYTDASGYNLVASARRGQKRIIAALFGGRSSNWRTARMARLLDKGFSRAATRVAKVPPGLQRVVLAKVPLPPAKPGASATGLAALAQVLGSQAVAATPPSMSRMAPLYALAPQVRPGRGDVMAEVANNAGQMPVPVPRPIWGVQLGEFLDREIAVARMTEVTLGNVEVLASAAPVIDVIRSREGKSVYRVKFVGLAPDDATDACRALRASGRGCLKLAPGT
jgi:D-alanyl-D-alanine carboxypeptidase